MGSLQNRPLAPVVLPLLSQVGCTSNEKKANILQS